MSSNNDEEKSEAGKTYPLDLASKLATVKTNDGKQPLIIPGPPLRGIRILPPTTQAVSGAAAAGGATIIATNLVPQGTIIKQVTGDTNRAQIAGLISTGQVGSPQVSGNITIQRQHITLSTTLPVVAQTTASTTYHVPRGPAVVANLSAPRSNVAGAIRGPLVVTATNPQGSSFARPPRTATPTQAQNTAWISSSTNGSQIKNVSAAALSSTVKGATITGVAAKPAQIIAKPQVVSTIKPTTILQSAIIGQGQIHQFKPSAGVPGIQTINSTLALAAQVVPNRTQTLVYCSGNTQHFVSSPRVTVANSLSRVQSIATRPVASATRLAVPVSVCQTTTRLVAPQATVLTSGARLTTITTQQAPVIGATPARIINTQANVSLGRLTVTVTNPSSVGTTTFPQIRSTSIVHPIVPSSNAIHSRGQQSAKVISQQTTPQAIHLTPMSAAIKSASTSTPSSTLNRTINAQTTIVAQRPASVVSSHAIPISKVFSHDGQQQIVQPTNIILQTPVTHITTRLTSPGPTTITQSTISGPTTTTAYTIANNSYFFDTASGSYSVARSFNTSATLTAVTQASTPTRPIQTTSQQSVHGLRYNPIVVVDQNRSVPLENQQQPDPIQHNLLQAAATKITSSPRPSILRKRDHDGSPLKAAKNLMPCLSNIVNQAPLSPPSRPESRNNGNTSSGSTTISATSSPGLADANDDSLPHAPLNKEEEENRPPMEMSPRKKPRKQNLAGNDHDEINDEMQFISERDVKKEQDESDGMQSDDQNGNAESNRRASVKKPALPSLLNSYRQTWKTTNNHYLRYSDVRPKDERRPTIIDLSNQHRVLDKVNGWKIHHLSTQMEDLAEQEQLVHSQLSELLKYSESKDHGNPDINRINELIKGNLQRVKIINDGMIDAKSQIMKVFDHKGHVTDIISRCVSKRNYKKREKT